MMDATTAERRRHRRCPLPAAVTLHHFASKLTFRARSVDVSRGGLLIYVPVAAPVAPGQRVALTLAGHNRPEYANLSHGPVAATIVRVDRAKMARLGYLPVGVRFDHDS